MIVGIGRLTLRASHCHSLKAKRAVVRKLRDRVQQRHHVTMAEVGGQDTWQRIALGFAVVGADRGVVESTLSQIEGLVEAAGLAELVAREREILVYSDEPLAESDASTDESWIPDSWLASDDGDGVGGGDDGDVEPGAL